MKDGLASGSWSCSKLVRRACLRTSFAVAGAVTALVGLVAVPAGADGARPVSASPAAGAAAAIVDLGALPGGAFSFAYGVNSTGQVVGYSATSDRSVHAVVWSPTGARSFGITDLGTLPGDSYSGATAINPSGLVAGFSGTSDGAHAVVWRPKGAGTYSITDLGTLPGGNFSTASGMNPDGVVAGHSSFSTSSTGPDHAVVWRSTGARTYSITDLGTLPGDSLSGASA